MVPESVLIDPRVGEAGKDPVSLLVYLLGMTQFRTAMVVLVLVVRAERGMAMVEVHVTKSTRIGQS